jgi:hypothetical protein
MSKPAPVVPTPAPLKPLARGRGGRDPGGPPRFPEKRKEIGMADPIPTLRDAEGHGRGAAVPVSVY